MESRPVKNFELKLLKALALDLPYSERYPIAVHAQAAVLILFAFRSDDADPWVLITRRTESGDDDPKSHSGQMAFPGGRSEEGELDDTLRTALRETEEEVGIPSSAVRALGQLPQIVTGTGYQVIPHVAFLTLPLDEVPLKPEPQEVAEALWVPWALLADHGTYEREMIQRGQIRFPTHTYRVEGRRIWGATGAMIKNLLDRFARIG